jgi:hypothetical protein
MRYHLEAIGEVNPNAQRTRAERPRRRSEHRLLQGMANKQLNSKRGCSMSLNKKAVWIRVIFILLMTAMLGLSLTPWASAADQDNIKKVQQTLRDKGFDPGPIDGHMGSQTREAISQYQKSENLPVTGHLDAETAGKLGVGPESVGGDFKAAGKDVGRGGEGVGHEMKQGKPIAAGKDLGEGVGKGGKKVGKGVKKAVSPHSDSNDPEKKQ